MKIKRIKKRRRYTVFPNFSFDIVADNEIEANEIAHNRTKKIVSKIKKDSYNNWKGGTRFSFELKEWPEGFLEEKRHKIVFKSLLKRWKKYSKKIHQLLIVISQKYRDDRKRKKFEEIEECIKDINKLNKLTLNYKNAKK